MTGRIRIFHRYKTVLKGWRKRIFKKIGTVFKPTTSIISLTLFSSVPIAMINRFIFFR